MKIYVIGNRDNNFLEFDELREKFYVNEKHEGDNIDALNPWYCELTGLYYIWKHSKEDIIGLEHYRRYFVNENHELLSKEDILNILDNHDIIMYKYIGTNAWRDMQNTNKLEDLKAILYTIREFYGEEYYEFFKEKCNGEYVYEGNMFVCKKELIDQYCKWLFDILKKYDMFFEYKGIDKKPRINGYLAEYMFGPWMEYNDKKIYDCPRQTYSRDLKTILKGHV